MTRAAACRGVHGRLHDATERLLRDVLAGLTASPKRISSKYLYDERGSALFERICGLEEYYPTRTELAIMRRHVEAMAAELGEDVLLIEPGSGASLKVRLLLRHLVDPAGYVPVDISREHLEQWARRLARELPTLPIVPVHGDFSEAFELPPLPAARRRVIYFPGSTIGNFTPRAATAWLARMAEVAGRGGGLLIGIDTRKDVRILEAAYNDRRGVTRAFNLNLLHRLRRELGADVRVGQFEHRAFYNEARGRIEMHLVSTARQVIRLGGAAIELGAGETIHTENSYKYSIPQSRRLLAAGGWRPTACWTDEAAMFSVHSCVRA